MKNKIHVADFETTTINTNFYKLKNDSVCYLWYLEHLYTDQHFKGTTIDTFIKCIKDNAYCFRYIYFHNLSFDGYFILKYLINVLKVKYVNDIIKNVECVSCLRNANKLYEIKYQFKYKNKWKVIIFRCSLRLLSSSVDVLGKSFNMSKYTGNEGVNFYDNEPYKRWEQYPKLFTDYLINDVKIVKVALLEFEKAINSLSITDNQLKWNNFLTIGALSYKLQQLYYLANNSDLDDFKINEENYNIASLFYYGGWTQFNPEIQGGIIEGKGYGVDYNSMYPSAMLELLPYGEYLDEPPEGDYLEFWEININLAVNKYNTVINLLNWNKKNGVRDMFNIYRYNKVQNNFTCYYLRQEFELLKKFYNFSGVKIVKKYFLKAKKWGEQFIRDIYNFRLSAKQQNNKGFDLAFKILLNAGYGKHSTRKEFIEELVLPKKQAMDYCINFDSLKFSGNISLQRLTKAGEAVEKSYTIFSYNKNFELDNYIVLAAYNDEKSDKFYNKWAAATITAYARIKLWTDILKLGPENFLYADTDSIYFKETNNIKKLNLHDSKLGALKVENEFYYFIAAGAKVYALFDKDKKPVKNKYSGISSKWLKDNISFELYKSQEQVFKAANIRPKYLKSGIALEPVDYIPNKRYH